MEKLNLEKYLILTDKGTEELRFKAGDLVDIKLYSAGSNLYEKDPKGGYDIPVRRVKGKLLSWTEDRMVLDTSHDFESNTTTVMFRFINTIELTEDKKRVGFYA